MTCNVFINPICTTIALTITGFRDVPPPRISTGTNQINLGASEPDAKQRDYLTTSELAARERIAERTALQWIADGRVTPPPVKSERSWIIAANYRILPPTAADSGSR